MAGQQTLPLLPVQLNEQVIDGAALVHPTVKAHNCMQLRRWLKCHGRPVGGNKAELIERVKNALRNKAPVDPALDRGKWLKVDTQKQPLTLISSSINFPDVWHKFPSINLPKAFDEASIYDYLVSSCIVKNNNYNSSDEENESTVIDFSTAKPLKRGQQYVESNHVTDIFDFVTAQNIYCLKSKIKASYKIKTVYSVQAMINSETGKIIRATCECKASSLGRCAHVAALLHVLLMQCKKCEKENVACTSQLCIWNKGSKKKEAHKVEHPYKIIDNNNNFKSNQNECRNTLNVVPDVQKTNNFVRELQSLNASKKCPSIWELLITSQYDDYELNLPRKSILRSLVYQLTTSLYSDQKEPCDITGGNQYNCEKWWQYRKILITASNIKYLSLGKSNEQLFNWIKSHLWMDKKFDNLALKYGRDNEEIARKNYITFTSKKFGFQVTDSGLWINHKYPGIGASPDGLVIDVPNNTCGLLEIKCPKILEHVGPTDLHTLTPQQKSLFYCILLTPTSMRLKRNHQYYYQIQTQMAITGRQWCDFVVWTLKGFHVERIAYDENFIEPVLRRISAFHQNVLAPEYFEMRIPRDLEPFDLSKSLNQRKNR